MNWLRGLVSVLISGAIAGVGSAMAVWSALPPDTPLDQVPQLPMVIALGTGLLAGLKDAQAMLMRVAGRVPSRRDSDRGASDATSSRNSGG